MNVELRTGVAGDATAIHNLIEANLSVGHLLPRTFEDIESHVHRFVVAVKDGHVIGIFTSVDACRALAELLDTKRKE